MSIKINGIEPKLLKKIEMIAEKENIEENKILNEIIKKGLETINKIPDELIVNKDTYNPNPERRMKFAGIIKTDEPFDTKKALNEIRRMEY
jgi:hypothetical protein